MTPSEKRLLAALGKFEAFWSLNHRVQSFRLQSLMKKLKVSDEFKEELVLLLDTRYDEMSARREERSITLAQDEKASLAPEIH